MKFPFKRFMVIRVDDKPFAGHYVENRLFKTHELAERWVEQISTHPKRKYRTGKVIDVMVHKGVNYEETN